MAFKIGQAFADTWTHTRSNTSKVNHNWTIDNYSFYSNTDDTPKLSLESSAFSSSTGNDDKLEWRLKLYIHRDCLSLFVSLLKSNTPGVKAVVKLCFLDVNYMETCSRTKTSHYVPNDEVGYHNFVEQKMLREKKILGPNDKLTIFCEIITVENTVSIPGKRESIHVDTSESENTEDFLRLFQTHDFSDVTLTVGGKDIPAHKTILVARSPVFFAMFKNDMKETKLSHAVIDDIDHDVFMEMLHFFYTGKVSNLEKMAPKLLAAAEKYDVEGLKAICVRALQKSLSIKNSVDILILSDMYNIDQLKTVATNFIFNNIKDIISTGAFESFARKYPDLMIKTLGAMRTSNNGLESLQALNKFGNCTSNDQMFVFGNV